MTTVPRMVVVGRRTEYDELLARHGTRGQVEFFLSTRRRPLDAVLDRHRRTGDALRAVRRAVPPDWRRAEVERDELARFVFEPSDIVVVLGQDGLVANVAKYLDGQPVIGVDPLPGRNAGVLVPHAPQDVPRLLAELDAGRARIDRRTMVRLRVDDGQELTALNEVFVGQPGHQSARYELAWRGRSEPQSSSGVIIGTGTGATGWCASIQRVSAPQLTMPRPDEDSLVWFVREAWPSPATGTELTCGVLTGDDQAGDELELRVASDALVAFGDGMEPDRLTIGWGQQVVVNRSDRALLTVG